MKTRAKKILQKLEDKWDAKSIELVLELFAHLPAQDFVYKTCLVASRCRIRDIKTSLDNPKLDV